MSNILEKRDPIVIIPATAPVVLPAAGASTGLLPTTGPINVKLAKIAKLNLVYTVGGAGGAMQWIARTNEYEDPANGAFLPTTIVSIASLAAVAGTFTGFATTYAVDIHRTSVGVSGPFPLQFLVRNFKWIQFEFAEFGNVGAPGTINLLELALDEGNG